MHFILFCSINLLSDYAQRPLFSTFAEINRRIMGRGRDSNSGGRSGGRTNDSKQKSGKSKSTPRAVTSASATGKKITAKDKGKYVDFKERTKTGE